MDNRVEVTENILIENIELDLSCPITKDHMHEPMVTADGFSYDKAAIENWIQHAQKYSNQIASPKTDLPLAHTRLIENRNLKEIALARANNEITIFHDIKDISAIHCPLTGRIMQDPIITSDGYSFEKSAFNERLQRCKTRHSSFFNPITNEAFTDTATIPNQTLKLFIQSWLAAREAAQIRYIDTNLTDQLNIIENQTRTKIMQAPWLKKEERKWRTELALKAIKNKQYKEAEIIISSWPDHVEKSSALLSATLGELNEPLSTLLIKSDFNIPENPFSLLIKEHIIQKEKLVPFDFGVSSDPKMRFVFFTLGVTLNSLVILLAVEKDGNKINEYIKGKARLLDALMFATALIYFSLLGIYTLVHAIFPDLQRNLSTRSLEKCTNTICSELINKTTITEDELFLSADAGRERNLQENTLNLLINNFTLNNNISDNSFNQLALTENIPAEPLSWLDDNTKEIISQLKNYDWWRSEETEWKSAVDSQKKTLQIQHTIIITPDFRDKLEKELITIANSQKPIDAHAVRKLLCSGITVTEETYTTLKTKAIEAQNTNLLKLLVFFRPTHLSIYVLNSVLTSKERHISQDLLVFLYQVISAKKNYNITHLLEHFVLKTNAELLKIILDPGKMSTIMLLLAIQNSTDSEVFPLIWHHYQNTVNQTENHFLQKITDEQHKDLIKNSIQHFHAKAASLLLKENKNIPCLPIENLLNCYAEQYAKLINNYNQAKKNYLAEYTYKSIAKSSLTVALVILVAGYLVNLILSAAKEEPKEKSRASLYFLFVPITLLTMLLTAVPIEYLCSMFYGCKKTELIALDKKINQINSNCIDILKTLSQLGFTTNKAILETASENYNNNRIDKSIYEALFDLADGKLHDKSTNSFTDYTVGFFTKASNYIRKLAEPREASSNQYKIH